MAEFDSNSAEVLRRQRPVARHPTCPFNSPSEREQTEFHGRTEMNRQQSGAHQQAYPDFGQDRGIGLRAVAAAIRYQGDASKTDRPQKREVTVPTSAVTQPGESER
jgi:hypothetical protein